MNCDARQDSILEYALGTLSGPELEELRAHLQAGCPLCEGKLAETQAMLSLLPLSLPPVSPPPGARQKLLSRLTPAGSGVGPLAARQFSATKKSNVNDKYVKWFIPALIGGAVAACITILVYSTLLAGQRKALETARSELSQKSAELVEVQAREQDTQRLLGNARETVQMVRADMSRKEAEMALVKLSAKDAEELLRMIGSPTVKLIELPGTESQPSGKARMVWDPATRSIRVYASNLKALPAGKGYELWLLNSGPKPMPAGTFMPNAEGGGVLRTTLAFDPGQVVTVAITDEPYNEGKGMPAPTGKFQFLRQMQ